MWIDGLSDGKPQSPLAWISAVLSSHRAWCRHGVSAAIEKEGTYPMTISSRSEATSFRTPQVVFIAFLLGLSAACGPAGLPNMVPIRGTVRVDGKPLNEGTVLYLPIGSGRQARGDIQPDGSFQLTTLREGDGAQYGEYQVVVIAYKPHPGEPTREQIEAMGGKIEREFAIPEKYTQGETSGITDTVDANHSQVKEIELSSSA